MEASIFKMVINLVTMKFFSTFPRSFESRQFRQFFENFRELQFCIASCINLNCRQKFHCRFAQLRSLPYGLRSRSNFLDEKTKGNEISVVVFLSVCPVFSASNKRQTKSGNVSIVLAVSEREINRDGEMIRGNNSQITFIALYICSFLS